MNSWTSRLAAMIAVLFLGFGVAVGVACSDDDDPANGSPSAVADPDPEPDPEADPDPEPDPEADPSAEPDPEAGDGVVSPKPSDAEQIDVVLSEWTVVPSAASVAAGKIYFLADNQGPDDPHELVIVKTSLAPDELPIVDGRVNEDVVEIIDEIEPFKPGTKASIVLELEAGTYVLLCNIAEEEEGELESHVELGMRTAFTVE